MTLTGLIRAMGGIRPPRRDGPSARRMRAQNGLFGVYNRRSTRDADAIASELAAAGEIPADSTGEDLLDLLLTAGGRLVGDSRDESIADELTAYYEALGSELS